MWLVVDKFEALIVLSMSALIAIPANTIMMDPVAPKHFETNLLTIY